MFLICASPYVGGLEKCSGDRTAGLPVQYGVGFFGLVNIMQPQQLHNKIEEAGLNFFLSLCFYFIYFL